MIGLIFVRIFHILWIFLYYKRSNYSNRKLFAPKTYIFESFIYPREESFPCFMLRNLFSKQKNKIYNVHSISRERISNGLTRTENQKEALNTCFIRLLGLLVYQ